jgi:hypothetical protein
MNGSLGWKQREGEEEKKLGLLTREEERGEHLVVGGQLPTREVAREEDHRERERERERRELIAREKRSLAPGSG